MPFPFSLILLLPFTTWQGFQLQPMKVLSPITGKSMLPHITDINTPIYGKDEGVGLESGNSSAYFLNGYKIVKNNIPYW